MTAETEAAQSASKSNWIKFVLAFVIVGGLFIASRFVDVQGMFRDALQWIQGLGFVGALVFFALYILACVLMLPGFILTLGAGAIYGVVYGTLLVSVSSTVGATAAFLVGRYLARDWIANKVAGRPKFKAVDDAVADEGWKIVGLTRLSPIFPFNLLNYAYGLTQVSLPHYFFASWIGMFPGTIVYVYLGSLAGELATLGQGQRERTPLEWALFVLGLVAAFAVTFYFTRIARRALDKRVDVDIES